MLAPSTLPPSFRCPITNSPMADPVVDVDGHSFERAAVVRWIARNGVSPVTRHPLRVADLRPNVALAAAIRHVCGIAPDAAARPSCMQQVASVLAAVAELRLPIVAHVAVVAEVMRSNTGSADTQAACLDALLLAHDAGTSASALVAHLPGVIKTAMSTHVCCAMVVDLWLALMARASQRSRGEPALVTALLACVPTLDAALRQHPADARVQAHGMFVLATLSVAAPKADFQSALSPYLDVVTIALRSPASAPGVLSNACVVLTNFACGWTRPATLLVYVGDVVAMLRARVTLPDVQCSGLLFLANVLYHTHLVEEVAARVVDVVLACMRALPRERAVHAVTFRVLYHVARCDRPAVRAMLTEAAPLVAAAWMTEPEHTWEPRVLAFALAFFMALAQVAEGRQAVAGYVNIAVRAIRAHADNALVERYAVGFLSEVASDAATHAQLLPHLYLALAGMANDTTQAVWAALLWKLSCSGPGCDRVLAALAAASDRPRWFLQSRRRLRCWLWSQGTSYGKPLEL
jgi:hypothetical protein